MTNFVKIFLWRFFAPVWHSPTKSPNVRPALDWNSHTDKIYNTISRYLGILEKLKHYLPMFTLKTLYNSLIVPNFMYGIPAWGAQVHHLYLLQKKAVDDLRGTSRKIFTMGYSKENSTFPSH